MAIFRTDIVLCATAYVQADTAEEAAQIMDSWHFRAVEFQTEQWIEEGLVVSGASFAREDFPELSLSPAMTVYVQQLNGGRLLPSAYDTVE